MRLGVSVLLLIVLSAPGFAQTTDSSHIVTSALRDAAEKNQIVRVRTVSEMFTGRVVPVSDTMFRVDRKDVVTTKVTSLEIRFAQPDPLLNGFLIGAAAGAVTLGPLAIEFSESTSERQLTTWQNISTVLISAAVGSLVGVAVDAARERQPNWRAVYPPAR